MCTSGGCRDVRNEDLLALRSDRAGLLRRHNLYTDVYDVRLWLRNLHGLRLWGKSVLSWWLLRNRLFLSGWHLLWRAKRPVLLRQHV
jgi:hypothetical protein